MKKIFLFSALAALCCAFVAVNSTKEALKVHEEVSLSEPQPLDKGSESDWDEYRKYADAENAVEGEATFEKLLEQFPKGTVPYSLTANVLRARLDTMAHSDYSQKRERNVLPRAFRKYFPSIATESKFSRMPPPLPVPFLAFEANGKHVLMYISGYGSNDFFVATFDKKGKLISEKPFANVNFKFITAGTLDENLNLTRMNYEVIWDKPNDKNGYKNCKITELKLVKKTVESLIKKDSEKEINIDTKTVNRANP